MCQVLTGWRIALVWVAAYTAVQGAEHRAFRGVSNAGDLGPGRTRAPPAIAVTLAAETMLAIARMAPLVEAMEV